MIYCISDRGETVVKIGFTTNDSCVRRWKMLQTGNPEELTVIGTKKNGTRTEELALHQSLISFRRCGEWFELNESSREILHDYISEVDDSEAIDRMIDLGHFDDFDEFVLLDDKLRIVVSVRPKRGLKYRNLLESLYPKRGGA